MAKITKKETLTCTAAEADAIIRNADGRVRFQVKVSAFLPTSDERGFEGLTFITISKSEARRVVRSMLQHLEERGARVRLHMSPPDPEFAAKGLSYISIY